MTTGRGVLTGIGGTTSVFATSSNGRFRLFFLFIAIVEFRGSEGATSPANGDGGRESVIFFG